ncbi:MAG: hypothetical protein AAF628_20590 [Planctomycetota bacterium]
MVASLMLCELMGTPRSILELAGSHDGQVGVVAGNGESRLAYDLRSLPRGTVLFGCNALYRDTTPHYLGSVDVRITDEMIAAYKGQPFAYVGPRGRVRQWQKSGRAVPELLEIETCSDQTTGPLMVLAAAVLGCNPIYLVGFDHDWTPRPGLSNSVYRDTALYVESGARFFYLERWRPQLEAVLDRFASTEFRQIGPNTLPLPPSRWEDIGA